MQQCWYIILTQTEKQLDKQIQGIQLHDHAVGGG